MGKAKTPIQIVRLIYPRAIAEVEVGGYRLLKTDLQTYAAVGETLVLCRARTKADLWKKAAASADVQNECKRLNLL